MKKNHTLYLTRGFNRAIFIFMVAALLLPAGMLSANSVISSTAKELASEGTQTDSTTYVSYEQFIAEHPEKESLFTERKAILRLSSTGVRTMGEATPVVLRCNMVDADRLFQSDASCNDVKLINITINYEDDLRTLDLSGLQGFGNLKYVRLLFGFDIFSNYPDENSLREKIKTIIPGVPTNVTVIWALAPPQ
ncbi:hypothetical protein LJC68_05435 [Bacteroidales bacterium OttesenSCG-928-B11]|nr:hypothetical protein [Bacteroidales bacterium OttesenSCG-928-E04]MDL2312300.1 hypothetical protein [Bacteroidales bacterium OttesenSCG-928-B11]MDL2326003.1 hypothetical protein [Bacteroidales bacterium OttesenSCG-928-A14]